MWDYPGPRLVRGVGGLARNGEPVSVGVQGGRAAGVEAAAGVRNGEPVSVGVEGGRAAGVEAAAGVRNGEPVGEAITRLCE